MFWSSDKILRRDYRHEGFELIRRFDVLSKMMLASEVLGRAAERSAVAPMFIFSTDMRRERLAGERWGISTLLAPTGAEILVPEGPASGALSPKLERNFGES